MNRQMLFDDERRPRRVLPDRLLSILVQPRLLGRIGRELRALDVGIDLFVLVVSGVEEFRWPRFPVEQRTQRPIRFAGRGRPADVVQPHRRGRRILPALDLLDALAGLDQRNLGSYAYLLQMLLQELRALSRG